MLTDIKIIDFPRKCLITTDDPIEAVGTAQNKQFLLTSAFDPDAPSEELEEYICLYFFNLNGELIEAQIENIHCDIGLDDIPDDIESIEQLNGAKEYNKKYASYMELIGEHEIKDIKIKPFKLVKNNIEFGVTPWVIEGEVNGFQIIPGSHVIVPDIL